MSNQWLRLWHDMPTDPKWRTIARMSGQSICNVISVWCHMLVTASNAVKRGNITGWSDEDIGSALDLSTDHVKAIREAMQGRVLDGERLTGWDERQPKREDNSSVRVRAYRESQKQNQSGGEKDVTQGNAAVTQGNAPDKDTDKEKKERKKHTKKEKLGSRFALTVMPEEWKNFCIEKRPDLDPDELFAEFKDYWSGVPGQRGRKIDWAATWRNRVRDKRKDRPIYSAKPPTAAERDREARKGALTIC
jgi:hypothetical protein